PSTYPIYSLSLHDALPICHPTAGPGVFVLTFFVTIAIAAPVVAPYPPYYQIDIEHPNHPPSAQFLLGTDPLSRDVWSRVVYGARDRKSTRLNSSHQLISYA